MQSRYRDDEHLTQEIYRKIKGQEKAGHFIIHHFGLYLQPAFLLFFLITPSLLLGTLAMRASIEPPIKKTMKFNGKDSHAYNFIADKYIFRFNVVTNFYEFKQKTKKKWKKYDDRYRKTILMELLEKNINVTSDKIDTFIEGRKFSQDFNPFEEYFADLKPWNGKTDYIGEIAKTVTTEDPERFRRTLERFLVGSIDCLMRPDSVNDVCLVFQSGQGFGKTRWMRSLLPKKFQSEYLYEGNIDTKNKDHAIYLSQYWFIHLDELESLRNNDISAIKSFITRQRISVRKAYGRYKTNFVRRASFLGSVNEDKFLSDTTGNRRWLVFKVKGIDYQHGINPDGLWAHAYKLYQDGYRHWFNLEEIKEINGQNEKFRSISLEEELFLRHFACNEPGGAGEMLSSSEAIQKIIFNIPSFASKMNAAQMGKALAKHSNRKEMAGGIQRYFIEYIGPPQHSAEGSSTQWGESSKVTNNEMPF